MEKILLSVAFGLLVLVGCTKDKDVYLGDQENENTVSDEEIKANVKSKFGVVFDANHDWNTTVKSSVQITADADLKDVEKVMVLAYSPYEGEGNGLMILNETETSKGQTAELVYDAPSFGHRLYAACVSKDGIYYIRRFEIGQQSVSFTSSAASRKTRAQDRSIFSLVDNLPQNPVLGVSLESYAKKRGYAGFENDKLFSMTDEDELAMMMFVEAYDYDDTENQALNDIIFTYLPNKVSNIEKIRGSEFYNEDSYPLTTGADPIILEPIYKDDGGYREVEYCHLYYYYFKDSDLAGKTEEEQVQFLKDLPKYKAFNMYPIVHYGGDNQGMPNKVLRKRMAYALIYWGDGIPVLGETVGSFHFPDGYRLGFMLRNAGKEVHQGELYCDGRLNGEVNKWGHLASAKLGPTDARMAWLTANNRTLLCCEEGTDRDFNDLVIEIEGGVVPPVVLPTLEVNEYAYCFEDTQLGDYDLNDVVIKAKRISSTVVEYSIVACGANDELCVRNIGVAPIKDDAEVHGLFKVGASTFINTVVGEKYFKPVSVRKTVAKTFSFTDPETQPYLYNKSKNTTVRIAKKGEDPHGIMIPNNFLYPRERVCVKDSYSQFNDWGQNSTSSTDWYKTPTMEKVYTNE